MLLLIAVASYYNIRVAWSTVDKCLVLFLHTRPIKMILMIRYFYNFFFIPPKAIRVNVTPLNLSDGLVAPPLVHFVCFLISG